MFKLKKPDGYSQVDWNRRLYYWEFVYSRHSTRCVCKVIRAVDAVRASIPCARGDLYIRWFFKIHGDIENFRKLELIAPYDNVPFKNKQKFAVGNYVARLEPPSVWLRKICPYEFSTKRKKR